MRELDEHSITDEVLRRLADCPDPRLHEVLGSLVRHLHGFAREVRLTEAEWAFAIDFLTRTGKMCDDKRQEFILLSDTLGLSTLVDAINNPPAPGATQSTVLGPFFVEVAPEAADGADLDPGDAGGGEPLFVDALVTDPAGAPVGDAVVDVWHSDAEGFYDTQRPDRALARRGRLRTGADGHVRFRTTMPASYPVPEDGPVGDMLRASGRHAWRPAHVHFLIQAPGFRRLATHVFVAGDEYLDSDAVFGVKESLISDFPRASNDGAPGRTLRYRFALTPG
jgi:hydroxyquinol 1,2-dioxygenase